MHHGEAIATTLKKANRIAVLTGAGVSTASGIPDFRSAGGIWEQDRSREYYMSSGYFQEHPVDFWKKYKDIFQIKLVGNYQPNKVHSFLREFEDKGKEVTIITQNVDGLHEKAGNSRVIEYHGSLTTATCPTCGTQYGLSHVMAHDTPRCTTAYGSHVCNDILKPDIVLFGDPITKHDEAEAIIDQADVLLVLGTSLFVMPFNFLPDYAKYQRNLPTILINREQTAKDELFDYVVHDDLTQAIEEIKQNM
ncbi:NAD-dependent protein deacylase [Pontibacillus yanchengensis]|uniref:protein acetyllysine N-acetyltransferase n=1 Tax=Pontibacillus yanchengensis Y32 TaxID=1385514 RepID=A0A0A2T7U5_9BACI|nr:NAD-dependent protein deacylase [Pontibacillus yanchengensis]KGP71609.1 NAD-dependent deacetylase [Pontibacillus yanchengensis Y32]